VLSCANCQCCVEEEEEGAMEGTKMDVDEGEKLRKNKSCFWNKIK
jgi:hypothetical protein